MSYTLEEFAADCRAALKANQGPEGREKVRQIVERALKDKDFVETHLGPDATKERDIIYEDPEMKFCICAHVNKGAKMGTPHDHGRTWAIYGQAEGETEMTDWRIVSPADGKKPAIVELDRKYSLKPGDAHLYQPGDVHAPLRDGPTKLIRIEGENTEKLERTMIRQAT